MSSVRCRIRISLFLLCAVGIASAPAIAQSAVPMRVEGFRCPGDNVAFWEEVKEAGWVGFGETWDFWTCDDGTDLFAEGATTGWKKMRPKRARMRLPGLATAEEVRLYTTAIPYLALGPLALIFLLAWLFAFVMRRRFTPTTTVTCGTCTNEVPIRDDEVGAFCPRCGSPMLIGDAAKAAA